MKVFLDFKALVFLVSPEISDHVLLVHNPKTFSCYYFLENFGFILELFNQTFKKEIRV